MEFVTGGSGALRDRDLRRTAQPTRPNLAAPGGDEPESRKLGCVLYTGGQRVTGDLQTTLARLSDAMNMMVQPFIALTDAQQEALDGSGAPDALRRVLVSRTSVILALPFLRGRSEAPAPTPTTPGLLQPRLQTRVRLTARGYTVTGVLHLPTDNDLQQVLGNTDGQPFLAVTEATVIAPHTQFEAPFLLVNRTAIETAGELAAG